MEDIIPISYLNDFLFCPISIYFHNLYNGKENILFQVTDQINGAAAHSAIDNGRYSDRRTILQALPVYSEKYGLYGRIDLLDIRTCLLTERKKRIKKIYDGYVLQIYAQYFALTEMGYKVQKLRFYSMDDNKIYNVPLPQENPLMKEKFITVIKQIRTFDMQGFVQENAEKCKHCIYEPACDRACYQDD